MTRRVGIDLGQRSPSTAVVMDGDVQVGKPFKFAMTKAGVEELVRRGTAGAEGPVAFLMEPTGNAWRRLSSYLRGAGHEVFLVGSNQSSRMRKMMSPHHKSDTIDAQAIASFADPRWGLTPLSAEPDSIWWTLQRKVTQRAQIVRQITEQKARIEVLADEAIPGLMSAMGCSKLGATGRLLLREFWNPSRALGLGRKRFENRLRSASRKPLGAKKLDEIWSIMEEAHRWSRSGVRIDREELAEEIGMELDLVEFAEKQVENLDKKIAILYEQIDPTRAFAQLPGVGEVIAPILESILGGKRFHSAKALVSYAGLCPRVHQSGTRCVGSSMTKAGNRELKRCLYLAADVARRVDPEFATKYNDMEAAGKHHNVILIALAAKLARRAYALLETRHDGAEPNYETRRPDGVPLTTEEAREWVKANVRNKAEREADRRREKAEAGRQVKARAGGAPVSSGQSEDSAIGMVATVPGGISLPGLPNAAEHGAFAGKAVQAATVENPPSRTGRPGSGRPLRGLETT